MTKVYQTIFNDGNHETPGNCWQAQLASLFDLTLDAVPHIMSYPDDERDAIEAEFLKKHGYVKNGYVYNPRRLGADGDFKSLTYDIMHSWSGINGYFSATVFSPKYFTYELMCDWDKVQPHHAVIIDNQFNIVHDPNINYAGIEKYPLADILGWNGVIGIDIINKM